MKKIVVLVPIMFGLIGCGYEPQIDTNLAVDNAIPLHQNVNKNNSSDFKKCSEKYEPMIGSYGSIFYHRFKESNYFVGHSQMLSKDLPVFTDEVTNLNFTEDKPCDQIRFSFEKHSVFILLLSVLRDNVISNLKKNEQITIANLGPSYFRTENYTYSDNISRLPNHNFQININCPSGFKVSCHSNDENCDPSFGVKVQFPAEACTIKGTNQVFALYPNGQIRINFAGTIKKTGKSTGESEELEIKISDVEWK